MKIAVTGATGFIGRPLVQELRERGHEVVVLSRNVARTRQQVGDELDVVQWDGLASNPDRLAPALAGVEAIANLAGESIASGRWTAERKRRILDSRVLGTRSLVQTIARLPEDQRPRVLVNASAVGYYGAAEQPVDESSPSGTGFLAEVSVAGEAEARAAEALGLRVVLARIGVVLGRGGGALGPLAFAFKLYLGGPTGSGRQPFPWVHVEDVVGMLAWALEHEAVGGPLNVVAPELLSNREFCTRLAESIGRPSWLPAPALALKLGLGEMSTVLLDGQAVRPVKAQELGYRFRFRTVDLALRDLMG